MTALVVTRENLRTVKNDLTVGFPEVKSSHLSEALASALGFNTNAALLARLVEVGNADADILILDESAFYSRLDSLGYRVQRDDLIFFHLEDTVAVLDTTPLSSFEISYASERSRAWRNLMVAGVNAGIEQKLFTVRDDDNRWPGYDVNNRHDSPGFEYDFTVAALPARAAVRDIGHGELAIHVAIKPTGKFLGVGPVAGFMAGEAQAAGWLERKTGAWLQSAEREFSCRKHLKAVLANLDIKPLGYGDRGRVMM